MASAMTELTLAMEHTVSCCHCLATTCPMITLTVAAIAWQLQGTKRCCLCLYCTDNAPPPPQMLPLLGNPPDYSKYQQHIAFPPLFHSGTHVTVCLCIKAFFLLSCIISCQTATVYRLLHNVCTFKTPAYKRKCYHIHILVQACAREIEQESD